MTPRDTPTQPPSAADREADAFAERLKAAPPRRDSGLIRALAEAWAESEKAK